MRTNRETNQEKVRILFDYRGDGSLIARTSRHGKVRKGAPVGSPDVKGYLQVTIDTVAYKVHRIVWLWHHGYIPEGPLDHINRKVWDNRIENLREVSHRCNRRNTRVLDSNTSGVTGVYWNKVAQKWTAQIKVNRKVFVLGTKRLFIEAVALRLAAEQCLKWGHCNSETKAKEFMTKFLSGCPEAVKSASKKGGDELLTFLGVTKSEREWSESLGGHLGMVRTRLFRGWSLNRAFTSQAAPLIKEV